MGKQPIRAVVWLDCLLGGMPLSLPMGTDAECIARAAELRKHEATGQVQHVRAVYLSETDELTYLD